MRKPFLIAMALIVAPLGAQAETWNIYGWQNQSWEFVDIDGGQSFDRIQSNAGNIGFAASVPTGMNDISVNIRCEQFTYLNHFAGGTGWCNRNSKISLSHPQMGEIMLATWLLPYNEGVAQWVDPFYDAGADSHTSIMGSVGAHTIFYNTGDFDQQASNSSPTTGFGGSEFNYAGGGYDTGFNRRQEGIIQYWSPNWNGFVFRFAWTVGRRDESDFGHGEVDPVIRSSSLAYTNGPFWGAVTWQDHEDWTAASVGQMASSDAESIRIAGRYIMDLGDGMSVQISAMWEDLEYEFNGVTSVDQAMSAFGYSNFATSGNLSADSAGDPFMRVAFEGVDFAPEDFAFAPADNADGTPNAHKTLVLQEKTIDLLNELFSAADANLAPADDLPSISSTETTTDGVTTTTYAVETGGTQVTKPEYTPPSAGSETAVGDLPFTQLDESADDTPGNGATNIFTVDDNGDATTDATTLKTYLEAWGAAVADVDLADSTTTTEQYTARAKYDALVAAAQAAAMPGAEMAHDAAQAAAKTAHDAAQATAMTAHESAQDTAMAAHEAAEDAKTLRSEVGGNVKIERDAWMVSGKIKFGGPVDFRFSYMDADDLEVSCSACSGDWSETAAEAWNVGIFYTMPAGTELRLTYSEVDNDANGTYGQGISGTGLGSPGAEIEMFALGIVHWFD